MSEAPAVPTTGASDLPRGQGSCLRTGEVAVPTMLRGQKGSVSPQEACPKLAMCDFDASVGGKFSMQVAFFRSLRCVRDALRRNPIRVFLEAGKLSGPIATLFGIRWAGTDVPRRLRAPR